MGSPSTLRKPALAALFAYAAWLALLSSTQEHLIFPGAFAEWPVLEPPASMESVFVRHPDGTRTEVWVAGGSEERRPLLVYLHGNGETIAGQNEAMAIAREASYALALPEYRGYGRSGGEPAERAITEDLVRVVDGVRARPSIDARRVVYFGRSLGAGFAAQLAARRPPTGLVLQTPLARIDVVALGYLAPPFLVRHPFRTDLVLAGLDRPTLVLEHSRDEVAPPDDSLELARVARQATLVSVDAGHNDSGSPLEAGRERRAILEFLERMAR